MEGLNMLSDNKFYSFLNYLFKKKVKRIHPIDAAYLYSIYIRVGLQEAEKDIKSMDRLGYFMHDGIYLVPDYNLLDEDFMFKIKNE